jgi:hypothetical protein
VFRALFAISLAVELPSTRALSIFAIQGGFHVPYLPFPAPVTPSVYQFLHDLQIPFIALLGLGILPRVCAGVLGALQGYVFFTDQLNFRNHPYFFLLLLLLLMFAPSGRAFSVPALLRRLVSGSRDVGAPLTVQRLIQVQVSIVYFYAALHKLTGQFLGGRVLADVIGSAIWRGHLGQAVTAWLSPAALEWLRVSVVNPRFWIPSAWLTVALELTLPVALWIPRWRIPAMIFGVGFHLAIGYTMNIESFSLAMIASYLLFLDPGTLPRVLTLVRPRLAEAPSPAAGRAKKPRHRR